MSGPDREIEEQRAQRAARRASWRIRRIDLAAEGTEDAFAEPSASLAAMWPLIVAAWTLSGRELPSYPRHQAPGVIWRAGSLPPEHAP